MSHKPEPESPFAWWEPVVILSLMLLGLVLFVIAVQVVIAVETP